MARIFKEGFLKAYLPYADTGYAPLSFHVWSALSIIAGALERKVYLPQDDVTSLFPNIYVLIVTKPGMAKSTSMGRAVNLIRRVSKQTGYLNIMPNKVTDARFFELMSQCRGAPLIGSMILPPDEQMHAGYYFASEASSSLVNVFGDFIATLTELYDCGSIVELSTKKSGTQTLTNVCMNILAGCTFDYLNRLVNEDSISGGFASRLIYVHDEAPVRRRDLQNGDDADRRQRDTYRIALITELAHLSKLQGRMVVAPEAASAWTEWDFAYETMRRQQASHKVQNIWARTSSNVMKVAMLLSAAESDSLHITLKHFEEARDLVVSTQAKAPALIRTARVVGGATKSPTSLVNAILTVAQNNTRLSQEEVVSQVTLDGHDAGRVERAFKALLERRVIVPTGVSSGRTEIKVLGNPDDYL